ncbi:amidohydrolase family protein [Pseudofrankia sp. DC12]|uniref:amidohydrolase family protein n=1 Tax=Pseudofrankia sp. DC12 TaxID=683315 RepID=UPI0005F7B2FF|nr:amidohydrolase family protein [Pseudofrankia sp. DC12]
MRDENAIDESQPFEVLDSPAPHRRSLLWGAAALGAATLAPSVAQTASAAAPSAAAAPGSAESPSAAAPSPAPAANANANGRIDVHHHAIPPAAHQWMVDHGLLPPAGGPPWANWTVESSLQIMDETGVAAAVLSGPAPSEFLTSLTPAQIAESTRVGNDALGEVIRDHPARFGFFAAAPLANVDVALNEIGYALDTLHADGVVLSMHAAGQYLGDPAFDPILAELDRRHAVAFTHPYNLPGCSGAPVADFLADFLADTTRAAVKMLLAGVFDRYPNISFILPHGGGFFPLLASRLQLGSYLGAGVSQAVAARSIRRCWYDSAAPISPGATPSLLATVGAEKLLFGSDFPASTADGARLNARAIDTDPALSPGIRRQINRENARRLLPALAQRIGG